MYPVLVIVGLIILICAPFLGVTWGIDFSSQLEAEIFWRIRVPRVLLGFLAGAALGSAGIVFQALFRNSLASPYTFGVASGASFGAALAILLTGGASIVGGLTGALLVTFVIYAVSLRASSSTQMLLAGVATSFFFSSLILFIQYISNFTQSFQIVRWLMGGLETTDYHSVIMLVPFVAIGVTLVLLRSAELDAISAGDEIAYSRGVDVTRVRASLFFISSLVVGAVVSFVGPIGFVGIMVPHMLRLLLGPRHSQLSPCGIFLSGCFLVACDTVARTILSPADLPVGIVTALLGGPFFICILLKNE